MRKAALCTFWYMMGLIHAPKSTALYSQDPCLTRRALELGARSVQKTLKEPLPSFLIETLHLARWMVTTDKGDPKISGIHPGCGAALSIILHPFSLPTSLQEHSSRSLLSAPRLESSVECAAARQRIISPGFPLLSRYWCIMHNMILSGAHPRCVAIPFYGCASCRSPPRSPSPAQIWLKLSLKASTSILYTTEV